MGKVKVRTKEINGHLHHTVEATVVLDEFGYRVVFPHPIAFRSLDTVTLFATFEVGK
jgi:hypothetical protein